MSSSSEHLASENAALQSRVSTLEFDLNHNKEENEKMKQSLEAQLAELVATREGLTARVEAAEAEKKALEEGKAALEAQFAELSDVHATLKEEQSQLAARLETVSEGTDNDTSHLLHGLLRFVV